MAIDNLAHRTQFSLHESAEPLQSEKDFAQKMLSCCLCLCATVVYIHQRANEDKASAVYT